MPTVKKLEQELADRKAAEKKAKKLLGQQPDTEKLAEIGKAVLKLSREHLASMLKEGYVSHHVTDGFEPTCLCQCFGNDYYDWVYDLQE